MINQKEYEDDLFKRQQEHLERVAKRNSPVFHPCMHDSCPECIGTGVKLNGSPCVHWISCTCPKCSPYSFATTTSYTLCVNPINAN